MFDLTISGSTEKYNEFLVSEAVAAELVRTTMLFTVHLVEKAAIVKYPDFEDVVYQAWQLRGSGQWVLLSVCWPVVN